MANLLPTKEVALLKAEQRRRIRASAFVLISGLCIWGTVLLIPSVAVLMAIGESVDKRLATTRQLIDLQKEANAGLIVAATKEKMDILSGNSMLLSAHDLTEKVASLAPTGVALNQIAFSRDGLAIELLLTGQAAQRSALLAFADALRGSKLFSDVTIPIESLAKDTDLQFRLTLSLAQGVTSL
jgi:hypothetical protein